MTVKVDLTPDIEAGLLAQAQARGLSLEAYAAQVLQHAATPRDTASGKKSLVELFAPLRGLDLQFSRDASTGRPVDL
jgi:hypothetical protein